jgi:hypothetical protein
MRLGEITVPSNISDDDKIIDILKSADRSLVTKSYQAHQQIKDDSTFNGSPYVLTPMTVYGDDVVYMITSITLLLNRLSKSGLNSSNQITKMLRESIEYLENKQ